MSCNTRLVVAPRLLVHCDWSVAPAKRWLAAAQLLPDGTYQAAAPSRVGPLEAFLAQLRKWGPTGPILAGFDFPIGLPRRYAERAGIASFPEALFQFGSGPWRAFYEPAATAEEVSIYRPFYPKKPGGTKKQLLVSALGLASATDLLRACDCATPVRSKACELFWTLGANQVGRAAIAGWSGLLAPALRDGLIALWPFHGDLAPLLESGGTVVAETYPAETYAHLGLERGFGKRRVEGRRSQARTILSWCDSNELALTPDLRTHIESGFGDHGTAEDMFDAVVGLLGLLEVVKGLVPAAIPLDSGIRDIEGWILGMAAWSDPGVGSGRKYHRGGTQRNVGPPARTPLGLVGTRLVCPACGKKEFARWPLGWDAHAAYNCPGVGGETPEQRKHTFKALYLK